MQMVVDILVLGAGWTSSFLSDLCDERGITYAATSRVGRESTIKFSFDPDSDDVEPYTVLPKAHTVLITFPIITKGASERLVRLYTQSHGQEGSIGEVKTKFIQLGTSSIWDGARLALKTDGPPKPVQHRWYDRHSPYVSTPRAEAEDELLALSPKFPTTVLNLSGLWGGARSPRNWVARVAPSKEALKNKGSLHVVHGTDVARAILAILGDFDKADGQRWLLSDGRVYDWWDLASAWGSVKASISAAPATHVDEGQSSSLPPSSSETANSQTTTDPERGPQATWVRELMVETGVRALPRDTQFLGRALDSRDFWNTFEINPLRPRLE